MNLDIFSQRLKEARIQKGLTQKQLSEKVNISATTLTNYETGKSKIPSADTLLSLSNALEVSIDWLLGNKKYVLQNAVKTDLTNIKGEDIENAFNVLFAAFGEYISIEEYENDFVFFSNGKICNKKPKTVLILDEHIQSYLSNYLKLSAITDLDSEIKDLVFNSIFPNLEFDKNEHRFIDD